MPVETPGWFAPNEWMIGSLWPVASAVTGWPAEVAVADRSLSRVEPDRF